MLTMGIDTGFENTKVVILRDGQVLAHAVLANGRRDLASSASQAMNQAVDQAGISLGAVEGIVATGDGGVHVSQAHGHALEALCCCRGAALLLPSAGTVLDMGAETCMAIRTQNGKLLNMARNDRCASGTGRILKAAAKILRIGLDELGARSLESQKEISINTPCAVFAESEIISRIHHQDRVEDIAKAVCMGLARRAHALILKVGQQGDVAVVGGCAANIGIRRALEQEMACGILIPDDPLIIGALGAALIATEKSREAGHDCLRS